MVAVLITLAAVNVLVTPTALWLAVRRQRQHFEDTRFALRYLTQVLISLNESVEHSLDCLVSLDATLTENPSESEANVKC